MTIASYSDLRSGLRNFYMDRADLTTFVDDFIDLSEAFFNVKFRCREMEATTDLSPTSNVCTLPTDYLEYKRVTEKASTRRPLDYITADAADYLYPDRTAGLSCHFMIVGSDLTALPLSSNDIELVYYQKIPALSDNNTTNWLLDRLPNLYLHAGLMYAAEFVKDDEQLAKEATIVNQYVDLLQELDNRAKFGNAGVVLTGNVW